MIEINFWLTLTYLFFFGLIFWSFLNAWLYRIREDISLATPSKCPLCNTEIKWYDNIPVLWWLFLWGKCRSCKSKISIQYPLVEFLTGVMFVVTFLLTTYHWTFIDLKSFLWLFWTNLNLWYYFVIFLLSIFTYFFIAVSVYDFKYKEIPNEFVIALLILSIPFILLNPWNIISWILWLLFFVGQYFIVMKLYKVEAVWMGDAKLSLALGFILWKLLLPAMFIAYFSAVAYAIVYWVYTKISNKEFDKEIPFGPFIYFWAYISLFYLIYPFNIYLF